MNPETPTMGIALAILEARNKTAQAVRELEAFIEADNKEHGTGDARSLQVVGEARAHLRSGFSLLMDGLTNPNDL